MAREPKTIIGWAEWVQLHQLGLPLIRAKVDTGARTSALHAFSIEPFTHKGAPWVHFNIHPIQGNSKIVVPCQAPLVDRRVVTDSGGKSERRYVIETLAQVDGITRAIQITLTNRDRMAFRMLLGRQAISKFSFLVNPSQSGILTKIKPREALLAYQDTHPVMPVVRALSILERAPALETKKTPLKKSSAEKSSS